MTPIRITKAMLLSVAETGLKTFNFDPPIELEAGCMVYYASGSHEIPEPMEKDVMIILSSGEAFRFTDGQWISVKSSESPVAS